MCEPAEDTIDLLAAAADGLLVPSEGDYPLEPFRWQEEGPLSPDALTATLGFPPDTSVETQTLDDFFAPLVREADWMDDDQRERARRIAVLREQLATSLADIVVYRIGRVQITVVIAGRTPEGMIGGLRTTLIET